MQNKFEYDAFLKLVEKSEKEAMQYKQKFVPERLYKYQPIGHGRMKQKRLGTVKREEIWGSRVKYLNDPFEFKMIYAEQDSNDIKEFYEDVLNRNEVICLSGKWNDKLMWAHYADSHCGMCLEYTFEFGNTGQVFPMTYVKKRQDFKIELSEWLNQKSVVLDQLYKNRNMTNEQIRLMHSCGKIMFTKDWVWKYENEFRIITRNHTDIENDKFDAYKDQRGSLHKTGDFDLMLTKIYLGLNCTDENKKEIMEVAQFINNNRIRKSIGHRKMDKKRMYQVLDDMEMLVSVWEIYADNKLQLKTRKITY